MDTDLKRGKCGPVLHVYLLSPFADNFQVGYHIIGPFPQICGVDKTAKDDIQAYEDKRHSKKNKGDRRTVQKSGTHPEYGKTAPQDAKWDHHNILRC